MKKYFVFEKNILKSKICSGIQKSHLENRTGILKLFKGLSPSAGNKSWEAVGARYWLVSIEITSLKCSRAHTMCWNKFLECSETFVSAILASRVKIGTLNYDAVPEDPYPSSPVSIFCSLLDFPKNIFWGNRTKIFFKLDDSSFLPGFERIGTSSDCSDFF